MVHHVKNAKKENTRISLTQQINAWNVKLHDQNLPMSSRVKPAIAVVVSAPFSWIIFFLHTTVKKIIINTNTTCNYAVFPVVQAHILDLYVWLVRSVLSPFQQVNHVYCQLLIIQSIESIGAQPVIGTFRSSGHLTRTPCLCGTRLQDLILSSTAIYKNIEQSIDMTMSEITAGDVYCKPSTFRQFLWTCHR